MVSNRRKRTCNDRERLTIWRDVESKNEDTFITANIIQNSEISSKKSQRRTMKSWVRAKTKGHSLSPYSWRAGAARTMKKWWDEEEKCRSSIWYARAFDWLTVLCTVRTLARRQMRDRLFIGGEDMDKEGSRWFAFRSARLSSHRKVKFFLESNYRNLTYCCATVRLVALLVSTDQNTLSQAISCRWE